MPNESFTIPVTKTVTTTEHVAPSIFQLALEWGTPTTPARAITLLRARIENGEWDESVDTLRAVIEEPVVE